MHLELRPTFRHDSERGTKRPDAGHVTLCHMVVGGNLNAPLNLVIWFAKTLIGAGLPLGSFFGEGQPTALWRDWGREDINGDASHSMCERRCRADPCGACGATGGCRLNEFCRDLDFQSYPIPRDHKVRSLRFPVRRAFRLPF